MKRMYLVLLLTVFLLCLVVSHGSTSDQKGPVTGGKQIVAMVNNEPITSEEFGMFLAGIEHENMGNGEKPGAVDYAGILDRMIDQKLFLLEARNIGIDTMPEVTGSIEENAKKTLAKMLVREELKGITVDMEEVEKRFKEVSREYKVTAVVFEKEDDAKEMEEETASGAPFDDIVKKVIAGGKTIESVDGKYLKETDLWPEVSGALSTMETGAVSPPIRFDKGYVIVRLEDVRYPDDPAMRERIMSALAKDQRQTALNEYIESLIKKYVTIDEKLLENIDYDTSVEKFNKYMEDKRVIARVKKGENVTVKELSAAFQDSFYHGVEDQIKRKGLNKKKKEVLEGILQKRVLVLEAKKQGIDSTDEYRQRIENYNRTIVFEQFLNRVIVPGIKFNEDELRAYYNEHPESYTSPEMMRIDSLVFDTQKNAEAAIQTLSTGTEFKWLKENAAGQVPGDAKGVLNFSGSVLSVKVLPEGVQKVLSGVSTGDFRIFTSPDGYHYVLYVKEVYPPSIQPYQDVKNEILKEMYNSKVKKAMEEWSDKLKAHYPVEIYLSEF